MTVTEELNRLNRVSTESIAEGSTIKLMVACNDNSIEVLEKIKEVLRRVIACELSFNDSVEDWKAVLPNWFVEACVPEITKEAAEELLSTSTGYETLSNMWTLSGFIHWFRPEQRSWYWWTDQIINSDYFTIELSIDGYPFAWGALAFLAKAAGTITIEESDSSLPL